MESTWSTVERPILEAIRQAVPFNFLTLDLR